ncbi:MAG: PIN domain-containing protein [Bdellovibrionales bacterium]|nr:PIN domain-containing protein [Bdellovibrionales bacterium]
MCLILDNNQWGDFLEKKDDIIPIHDWLEKKNGKLIYSNHEKFKELSKKYKNSLETYRQAGKAKLVLKEEVEEEIKKIRKSQYIMKSNDDHILGLAKAGNIKVLCSKDKNLHKDFTTMIPHGKIYQTKNHKHLLVEDLCP